MRRINRFLACVLAIFALVALLPTLGASAAAPWDGSVDISWYDAAKTEFSIDTPAKLAGLAALVNGMTDPACPKIIGDKSLLSVTAYDDVMLVGAAGGSVSDTVYASNIDFAYKTVYITADLDMGGAFSTATGIWSGPNWTPIGGKYSMNVTEVKGDSLVIDSRFNGVLDGGGHTISNIYCNRFAEKGFPYSQAVGLVGYLGGSSDLNTAITGDFAGGWQPTARNIVVGSGYIYGRRMVGSIVGRVGETTNGVIIESCANYAQIRNTDSKGIGGILGAGWGAGVIRNCYNVGSVTTTYACPAGGICGSNNGLYIYNCYNVGKIDSNGQKRGRGIGGHDAGAYIVANCYYLDGCDDDPASNGWYRSTSTKITIDVMKMTSDEMKSSLLGKLNATGEAFAADTKNINSGYPVLYFQGGGSTSAKYAVTVKQSDDGTVTADATGDVAAGKTVSLTAKPDAGFVLKHFTLNGKVLKTPFFTVSGVSEVGAVFGKVTSCVISLPTADEYYLSVTRTGNKPSGATSVFVENEPVRSGDTLYEGNVLKITAVGWANAASRDMNLEYTDAFTIAVTNTERNSDGTYTVGASDSVAVTVTRGTQAKSWLSTADTSWYTERRTEYTLKTGAELAGLAYLVNIEGVSFEGITVKLANDVSLKNTDGTTGIRTWKAIGTNTTNTFRGTFDGCGFVVRDMTARNDGSYAGLFGCIVGATIRNVTVVGTVECGAATANAAGIVAYASAAKIENCVNRATVTARGTGAAGIAAYICDGTSVTDCENRGAVSGTTGVGGIAGICYSGEDVIARCVNYGTITAAGEGAYGTGGIVGRLAGRVDTTANYGAVTSADRYTGGIAGYATTKNRSVVAVSLNAATVKSSCVHANAALGGLVGYAQYAEIKSSKNSGAITRGTGFASEHCGEEIGRVGELALSPDASNAAFLASKSDTFKDTTATKKPPFTAMFVADGKVVATVAIAADGKITAPTVPQKVGHTARWDYYETGDANITVNAVYRQKTVSGGDKITASGTYFTGFGACGELTIGGNLDVVLDGSNGLCEGLEITAGAGTRLTLRNVEIHSAAAALTMSGGTLHLNGSSSLASISDARDNENPAFFVDGSVEITAASGGSLTLTAGVGNSAISVADGGKFTLTSGALTLRKTELFGGAGGALHAPQASVEVRGGTLTGWTNSDNVAVIFAKNFTVSGGTLRLQAEKSPIVIDAASFTLDGGSVYAVGHSGNSAAENRHYRGRESVRNLVGTVHGTFEETLRFDDVTVIDDCFGGIVGAVRAGYFNGTSEAAFSPDSSMTRAMFVTVLYRMAGSPNVSGGNAFADVPRSWYYDAVTWAVRSGITGGTSATTFSPNDAVTAEQAAVFLARYAIANGQSIKSGGTLVRGVADWAQDAVSWAIAAGKLDADTPFNEPISRARLAHAIA